MTEEQFAFIQAINEYKRLNNCPFPTWTEVLDVVKYLGYRKVAEVGEFSLVPRRPGFDPALGRPTPAGPAESTPAGPDDGPL